MKKIILLLTVFFCCVKVASAQSGQLDLSFGNNGIVIADLGSKAQYNVTAKQVLLQSDGGLYVLLNGRIAKRHADGSADLSYGYKGYSSAVGPGPSQAALLPDGKTIVAGSNYTYELGGYFILIRLNTDGSLDKTFGENGQKNILFGQSGIQTAHSLAIQSDGKIIIVGEDFETNNYFLVVRCNSDGSLDNTFANNGIQRTFLTGSQSGASSIATQTDGKIIVAGYNQTDTSSSVVLIRYNENGSIDNSFASNGEQMTNIPTGAFGIKSLTIQSDGKIVVGHINALLRYNSDGIPDSTFDGDGIQTTAFPVASAAVQSDGKIVTAGSANNDFIVSRYNIDGSIDNTFSNDGSQTTDLGNSDIAKSMALANDGKIVVAGNSGSAFALARYELNGSLDNTFAMDGKLTDHEEAGNTVYNGTAVQADGKVVAAGYTWNGSDYDFVVSRYNTDGSPDKTFSNDGTQITDFNSYNNYANAVAIQNDGKIVLAGYAVGSGVNDVALVRYNIDGSLDSTFSGDGIQITSFSSGLDFANAVAIQADGKIVIGGGAGREVYPNTVFALARYNIDGTLDNSFSEDGMQTTVFPYSEESISSVALQNDGKIVATGGTENFIVARYNIDGSLDNSFANKGIQTTAFPQSENPGPLSRSVAIGNDGKIVVGGYLDPDFKLSHTIFALARYNQDGSLDSSFSEDGMQVTIINNHDHIISISIQSDGKVIAGGLSGITSDGPFNFALARYLKDGTLDNSFGTNGVQITDVGYPDNNGIRGTAIKNDKLYAVGYGNFIGSFGIVARYFLNDTNQTIHPSVKLTLPENNTTYPGPAIVYLTATASETGGSIAKVEFYSGSTLLHTEHASPYGFTWNNVPVGNYALTAKAYDNIGGVASSNTINISVIENESPFVYLALPASDVSYGAPASVYLNAVAGDADGHIKSVAFYNGSTLLHTEYVVPYGYIWKDISAGEYTVTARATDNSGLAVSSAPVHISIVNITTPSISITSPANNAGFTENAPIKINATAADPVGVKKVEFYNGNTLLNIDYTSAYTYVWNNVLEGDYMITARSVNNNGEVLSSAPIHISVVPNSVPRLHFVTPINHQTFEGPANIQVTADAGDALGDYHAYITKVEFYSNGNLFATEYAYPYSFIWKNVQPGKYILIAKAYDNSGAVGSSETITINVTGDDVPFAATMSNADSKVMANHSISKTGLFTESLNLKLLPNPVHNTLHISINGQQNKTSELYIISASGVVIKNIHAVTSSEIPLDVSSLVNGVYFIKVISGDKVLYKRFVKL